MQPKQLIIGTIIAVALVATYFALRKPTTDIKTLSPKSLAAMPTLERIEIIPAKLDTVDGKGTKANHDDLGGKVADKIVLTREGDTWSMTSPIKAELTSLFLNRMGKVFDQTLGTDDLLVDASRAADYGLSESLQTQVKFYLQGQDKPAQELFVGKELTIPNTSARRTYVKFPGEDRIYRLQADLGFLRQRDAQNIRSKIILELPQKAIKKLTIAHKGQPPIVLERVSKDQWQQLESAEPMPIDTQTVDFILNSLSSLALTEFTDDLKPEEVGLLDPDVTLTIQGDAPVEQPLILSIAKQVKEPDFTSVFYVKRSDRPGVYPISSFNGGHLTPDATRLRHLHPRPIDRDSMREIRFMDTTEGKKDKIVLKFIDEKWQMVEPVKSETIDGVQLKALIDTLSDMRIGRYAREGEATGLDNPDAERVEVITTQGNISLIIGDKLKDDENAYWGKFSDAPMPFLLTKYMIRQFKPALNTLLPPEKLKELGLSTEPPPAPKTNELPSPSAP